MRLRHIITGWIVALAIGITALITVVPQAEAVNTTHRIMPMAYPTGCKWVFVDFYRDAFSGYCTNANGGSYRTRGDCVKPNGDHYTVSGSRRNDGKASGSACTNFVDDLTRAWFTLYTTNG